MNIKYRNSVVFLDGVQPEQWIDGTFTGNAIQKTDGTYLSVQPDGTLQDRPAVGPWETCSLNSGANTVTYSATGIAYQIPIRGR